MYRLKNKESRAVTTVTFIDSTQTTRTFRIDWKNGAQFEEWVTKEQFRGQHVYVAGDDRRPTTVITTVNEENEIDIRYFNLLPSHVLHWVAEADTMFPSSQPDRPGRPIKRALEMLTTRQRRLLPTTF